MMRKHAYPGEDAPMGELDENKRPAVLLITTDQLRRDALGCYGGGAVPTPNIDALAARGMVFDAAYSASPWCLPSRASLITGLYPRRHRAYSNFRTAGVDPVTPNVFQMLHELDYTISVIGKCHFAPVDYAGVRPDETLPYEDMRQFYLSLGIDNLDLQDDKQVSAWFQDDYAKELDDVGLLEAYRASIWTADNRKMFTFPGPAEWHPDRWVGRKARVRIQDAEENPQFIWMSFSGPHFPFDPPAEYLDRVDLSKVPLARSNGDELADPSRIHHQSRFGADGYWIESDAGVTYDDEDWAKLRHYYYANVALIDDMVGEAVSAARARFGENLVIVFVPDHGEMLGNHGIWGKGYCFYEDVLRVPLILNGPDVTPGQRTTSLVSLTDIMPTILTSVGGEVAHAIDGASLNARCVGHPLVWAEGQGFQMVTDGVHKLVNVRFGDRSWTEMYNLDSDPGELQSIAGQPKYAEIERDLQAAAALTLLATALP